jgi:hypothetical protein
VGRFRASGSPQSVAAADERSTQAAPTRRVKIPDNLGPDLEGRGLGFRERIRDVAKA